MPTQAETVAILGVGLIGGSIGMALRARGVRVLGIGRDPKKLELAISCGAIDRGVSTDNLENDLASVQVAVVCTPVDRIASDAIALARAGRPDLMVTDAGSTKRALIEAIEADARGRETFVGAHPIAGSEQHGVAHSRVDLFEGRVCALTPTAHTHSERLARARSFWGSLGCRLIELDPVTHDQQLALTSHLPHALASALASLVPAPLLPLAAGAYRDGTRVAGADAALWASIFLENRNGLLDALTALRGRLDSLESAIHQANRQTIEEWWEVGRANRLAYITENSRNPVAL